MKKTQSVKIIKWIIAFIPPSLFTSFVSLTSIWIYLMRLGRQDLFMDFVSFKDTLGALTAFSLLSFLSFSFVFYFQSFLTASFLSFSSGYEDDRFKRERLSILLTSSASSILLFYLSIYIDNNFKYKANFSVYFSINCLLCIILSYFLLRKKGNTGTKENRSFIQNIVQFLITPSFIGFSSFFLVFPLSLIFKTIEFPDGTSDFKELAILVPLSLLIALITIIPIAIITSNDKTISFFRKIATSAGVAFTFLFMISIFIPGLPLMILNTSLRTSGVIDYQSHYFSVPTKNYPKERLRDNSWETKTSADNNFLIFKGATFLSMGTIKLICPVQVTDVYMASMKSRLLDVKYDTKQLNKLKQQAKKCLVFRKNELAQWSYNDTPSPKKKD